MSEREHTAIYRPDADARRNCAAAIELVDAAAALLHAVRSLARPDCACEPDRWPASAADMLASHPGESRKGCKARRSAAGTTAAAKPGGRTARRHGAASQLWTPGEYVAALRDGFRQAFPAGGVYQRGAAELAGARRAFGRACIALAAARAADAAPAEIDRMSSEAVRLRDAHEAARRQFRRTLRVAGLLPDLEAWITARRNAATFTRLIRMLRQQPRLAGALDPRQSRARMDASDAERTRAEREQWPAATLARLTWVDEELHALDAAIEPARAWIAARVWSLSTLPRALRAAVPPPMAATLERLTARARLRADAVAWLAAAGVDQLGIVLADHRAAELRPHLDRLRELLVGVQRIPPGPAGWSRALELADATAPALAGLDVIRTRLVLLLQYATPPAGVIEATVGQWGSLTPSQRELLRALPRDGSPILSDELARSLGEISGRSDRARAAVSRLAKARHAAGLQPLIESTTPDAGNRSSRTSYYLTAAGRRLVQAAQPRA